MPLYEYKCAACDKVFEVMQKFSDEPLTTHPGCGGHVERLLSAPALQFKGSGWYVTDYGRNGSGANSHKEKTDAKPDTKKSEDGKAAASATPAKETPAKSE